MPDPGRNPPSHSARCGLYVHVPFCESKCGYCDFYSVPLPGRDAAGLIDRITRELELRLADARIGITTVFCGGGTPTVLPVACLAGLLESVGRLVPVSKLTEFTVEANPATIDDHKARLLAEAGVTRVSMGAQSFFADELGTLGRLHKPGDVEPSLATIRRNGIAQVNLDLIFGIPGQTLDTWSQSLRRTIDLDVEHIACYGLTYEPGTRLTALRDTGRIKPCSEQLEADMYLLAVDVLTEAGYEQYETSNFARPGKQCQHNLIYWRNEPYVGVGPSAAGCLGPRRYKNVTDVDDYVRMIDEKGHAEAESETIDSKKLITEMIMMQLRLIEGLSIETFRSRTGADPLLLFARVLDRLIEQSFMTVSGTHIAITPRGRLVSDAIMAELVCAEAEEHHAAGGRH